LARTLLFAPCRRNSERAIEHAFAADLMMFSSVTCLRIPRSRLRILLEHRHGHADVIHQRVDLPSVLLKNSLPQKIGIEGCRA